MSQVVVKAENLSKRYKLGVISGGTLSGDVQGWINRKRGIEDPRQAEEGIIYALKDINFEVQQGTAVGIIGKNGAGKSTLLKLLARITAPTTGSFKVKGRVAALLEVGTGFHPELTGRENTFLNGTILGMRKAEVQRKFDEIVSFAGVEKFIDTPVKRYSSGMRVRLAFAVAAHLDPEILIIDEVLAVGDAEFQKKCLGKMETVSKNEGRTILFVSHQLGMIRKLCSRSIMLEKGRLVMDGASGDVLDHYLQSGNAELQDLVAERVFPPREELDAQILSVRLLNERNEPTLTFDVFEPIFLELTYIMRTHLKGVDVGLVLERNGETLAVSFDTDRYPERLDGREPGQYTVRLQLPRPLKAGNYKISNLGMGKTNVGSFHANPDILQFFVEERSFDGSLKSYSVTRPGVMVTELSWDVVNFEPFSNTSAVGAPV